MQVKVAEANIQFQSTLPHGERRDSTQNVPVTDLISIHAPAWGATDVYYP